MSGWGSYPDKVQIDFTKFYDGGLFLITGPTGAGKTTIFDAISFALYGDVSGKIREKTSVRSDFASPETDTYVEFSFTHKGEEYNILRSPKYFRPKRRGEGLTTSFETAELYIGETTPMVTLNEVNRKMDEIMGINYEQFKQIAMIAQGEFLELLVSSSKERVEILRNLFKTSKYERVQKLLSEQAKNLYAQIQIQKNMIDEAIHNIDSGENEELETCLIASDINYDKILILSKECIQEDKKTLKNYELELALQGIQVKEIIVSITEGEQINANLTKLDRITKAWKEKNGELESIQKQEHILKIAEFADKVKGEERSYLEEGERHVNLLRKIDDYKKEIAQLEPEYIKSTTHIEETKEEEDKILQLQKEYTVLEGYLPLFDELMELRKNLADSNKRIADINSLEETLKVGEATKNEKKRNYQKEYNSYEDLEKQISENHLLLQKGEDDAKKCQTAIQLLDRLIEDKVTLKKLQETYISVREDLNTQSNFYQAKEESYKNAIVGIVAKLVKEKEPCPVCGSLDHPRVAKVSRDVPDEKELEKLKKSVAGKQREYDKIYRETAKLKAQVDSREEQIAHELMESAATYEPGQEKEAKDNLLVYYDGLQKQLEELTWSRTDLTDKEKRKDFIKKELEMIEITLEELKNQRNQNVQKYNEAKSEYDTLKGNLEHLISRLPKHLRKENNKGEDEIAQEIHEKMEQISKAIESIKEEIKHAKETYDKIKSNLVSKQTLLKNSRKEIEEMKEELDAKKDIFHKALIENGFESEEDYKKAILSKQDIEIMSKELKKYHDKLHDLYKAKEALKEQIGEKTLVDLDNLKNNLKQLEAKQQITLSIKESTTARLVGNQKAFESIRKKLSTKQQLEEEYGVVKDLDNTSKGNNKERLVFEQYVLASYFEDIIIAANQRLSTMTSSRYELLKVDRVADARTTDSLNLEVLDNYTGKKRSVKTLSGGESFKAALSLALGLSDIVQNNAGGIQIDTLFIDEGFGSLDAESLDQALDTLTSLSENNRFIGIISHVNELKERIDNQIIVEKGNNGSKIKV